MRVILFVLFSFHTLITTPPNRPSPLHRWPCFLCPHSPGSQMGDREASIYYTRNESMSSASIFLQLLCLRTETWEGVLESLILPWYRGWYRFTLSNSQDKIDFNLILYLLSIIEGCKTRDTSGKAASFHQVAQHLASTQLLLLSWSVDGCHGQELGAWGHFNTEKLCPLFPSNLEELF